MVRRFCLICDPSAEIPSWNSFSEFHIMEDYSAWGKHSVTTHSSCSPRIVSHEAAGAPWVSNLAVRTVKVR
jgi:hypothetical protein